MLLRNCPESVCVFYILTLLGQSGQFLPAFQLWQRLYLYPINISFFYIGLINVVAVTVSKYLKKNTEANYQDKIMYYVKIEFHVTNIIHKGVQLIRNSFITMRRHGIV